MLHPGKTPLQLLPLPFAWDLFLLLYEGPDHVIPRIFSRDNIGAEGKNRRWGDLQRTSSENWYGPTSHFRQRKLAVSQALDEGGTAQVRLDPGREMLLKLLIGLEVVGGFTQLDQ